MDHIDRELFLYRILRGVVDYKNIRILPPTREVYYRSCEFYISRYESYVNRGLMTQLDLEEWMNETGYWTKSDDDEIEKFRTMIEDTKLNAFERRSDKNSLRMAKTLVKDVEFKIKELFEKKAAFYRDTCEGMANTDKTVYIIENTSFVKNSKKLHKYEENIRMNVLPIYYSYIVDEDIIRDICKNEPWKTMWGIRKNTKRGLFSFPKREMTSSQRMLIAWSQTYDNVYESMESPTADVISDDFLLDGWFIKQSKKRKTSSEQEDITGGMSDKVKNSQEVFKVVGLNSEEARRVNKANTPEASIVKKQREAILMRNGKLNE